MTLRRAVVVVVPALLAVVIMGPLLFHPGYALVGDMVFVPDQPWKAGYLGLDGLLPRSVPTDAAVWMLGVVLPGPVVQRLILVGAVVLAAAGMYRLTSPMSALARWSGVFVLVWSAYTHDRLAIGQWPLILGLATLPWVVHAAVGLVARPGTRRLAVLTLWLALAALANPSSGVTAAAVAVAVVLAGGAVRLGAATALVTIVVNLPWLIPGLLADAATADVRTSVEAFGARAESGLGVLASVLTGGGIWKESVAAPERGQVLVMALTLGYVALGTWGAARMIAGRRPGVLGLAVVAVAGLLLAAGSARWPVPLAALIEWAPGLGMFRDTTRYLAPWLLLVAWGVSALADAAVRQGRDWSVPVAAALLVWPVAMLPSLAWGVSGDLDPVRFPAEWRIARGEVEAARTHGALDGPVIVLPWQGTYRRFEWNRSRAALDPAPRFFPGDVRLDDRVLLGEVLLGNEDAFAGAVTSALASTDPLAGLRAAGVAGVIVERDAAGATAQASRLGLQHDQHASLVHQGEELSVWALAASARAAGPSLLHRLLILIGDALALAAVALASCKLLVGKVRYGQHSQGGSR